MASKQDDKAKDDKKAKQGGLRVRGRFSPGSEVTLTRASGPEQQRPGPSDEVVDTATVDKDGALEFSGTEPGERYFASGYVDGQPVEMRLTGREDADDAFTSGYEGVPAERQKFADGTWADEPIKRPEGSTPPEGTTWLAQDQVPEGTPQRSDTIRGTAAIISAEELERAEKQWKRPEPDEKDEKGD